MAQQLRRLAHMLTHHSKCFMARLEALIFRRSRWYSLGSTTEAPTLPISSNASSMWLR